MAIRNKALPTRQTADAHSDRWHCNKNDFLLAASTHYSADTSGGAITINLPALSGVTAGTEIRVKLKTAGNTLTLDGNSAETIDGSTTYTLTVQNQAVTLVSDGSSNWEVI